MTHPERSLERVLLFMSDLAVKLDAAEKVATSLEATLASIKADLVKLQSSATTPDELARFDAVLARLSALVLEPAPATAPTA
jgi:hypothetical protein